MVGLARNRRGADSRAQIYCTRTDATKQRRSVRWTAREGTYPAEGARGVRFPYVTPRKPLLTVTAGYRRGLENTSSSGSVPRSAARPDLAGPSEILGEVLVALEAEGMVDGRSLQAVHLTPYFTVVQLDDGSVGAGMSYYRDADSFSELLPAPSLADPLLLDWLFRDPDPVADLGTRSESGWHLVRSLRTAVLSALSAPLLRDGGGDGFEVSSDPPIDPFAEAKRAVVIGFGGYVDRLAEAPRSRTSTSATSATRRGEPRWTHSPTPVAPAILASASPSLKAVTPRLGSRPRMSWRSPGLRCATARWSGCFPMLVAARRWSSRDRARPCTRVLSSARGSNGRHHTEARRAGRRGRGGPVGAKPATPSWKAAFPGSISLRRRPAPGGAVLDLAALPVVT